jgi:hypothetical protein
MTDSFYPDDLPILTEAIVTSVAPEPLNTLARREFSETQMETLLQHFQTHLETVFSQKLNRHLEQLHHQAVKLAIAEFQTELPDLLRNLINSNQP